MNWADGRAARDLILAANILRAKANLEQMHGRIREPWEDAAWRLIEMAEAAIGGTL
jgi:hypothetical protein